MSVYQFVPSVFGILLPYSMWAVATFGRFHSTWKGYLACDVLFRMPACDVIHYSRSPALMNLMHGQVPATIPKLLWLTLFTQMAEIIIYYWPGWDSANCTLCMLTHTEAIPNSVLWHILVFLLKYQPRRERELRKMRPSLRRERMKNGCIVIAVDVCNIRAHSVSCKMQRKSCKSHVFFSPRHPMRKIKPPYI